MKDNRKKDRTLFKDFLREIGGSLNRYLSILLIVMLGVAFYAGVRSAQPDMQLSADTLYVAEVFANQGPTLKRFRPRAQGRASRIRKRTSHITIILDQAK